MEITYHNGKKIERNDYITVEKDDIKTVLLEGREVNFRDLPKLNTKEEVDIRHLNFGAKTFVIYKDKNEKLEYFFMYEQKIKNNKMEVVDYMMTTIIPECNRLFDLVDKDNYNPMYEVRAIVLLSHILELLNYVLNPASISNQIVLFLNPAKLQKEEPVAQPKVDNKTLTEIAKETGIPYKTLWGRVKVRGVSLDEAIAKGYKKGKPAGKRKYPEVTYNGKTLKELAKEYNMPYWKLWDRVHKRKWTIERALGIEKVGGDNE